MDPKVDFWGAGGFAWNERFGMADLFLAQNMGLLYAGAIVPVVLVVGLSRGLLWSREIRFFTIATVLIAFYMFGWYTPVFRAMYEMMPGVKLFRRPADATFVFGALIAIMAGYLVHRWLTGMRAREPRSAHRRNRHRDRCTRAFTIWLAATTVGTMRGAEAAHHRRLLRRRRRRWCSGFRRPSQRRARRSPAMILIALFTTADLAWNNAPHESTGLPPAVYDALRPDTQNETVALIKQRLAATRSRTIATASS